MLRSSEQSAYSSDALNRRIGTDLSGSQTWTVYDGQNPYADFVPGGSGGAVLSERYLDGPALDELLARTSSSGSTAWYLTDKLGTVRDIADTSGNVLDHLSYDSYGNVLSESNSANGGRFKFASMQLDSATGLYFDNARYYDPTTGRFVSRDPMAFAAGDPNLYRYVGNGTTDATDPTGLDETGVSGGTTSGAATKPNPAGGKAPGVNASQDSTQGTPFAYTWTDYTEERARFKEAADSYNSLRERQPALFKKYEWFYHQRYTHLMHWHNSLLSRYKDLSGQNVSKLEPVGPPPTVIQTASPYLRQNLADTDLESSNESQTPKPARPRPSIPSTSAGTVFFTPPGTGGETWTLAQKEEYDRMLAATGDPAAASGPARTFITIR